MSTRTAPENAGSWSSSSATAPARSGMVADRTSATTLDRVDATISPAMCFAGRDLTEPTLDPSGRRLAFAARAGSSRAIVLVDLDDARPLERHVTAWPSPATGRSPGGGCFAWLPDGAGLVYAATDGGLWRQPVPGGAATCLVDAVEGSTVASPAVAADGAFMAFERDQAGIWRVGPDGGEPERLDGGEHAFCLDPAVAPDGRRVAWQAWSPPDMPWDGAVLVELDLVSGARATHAREGGAWQQPRFAPDGTLAGVHDGSGWLNVHWGERAVAPEPFEQAGPTWGPGQRSFAIEPGGRRLAYARNEEGFGRLVVVDTWTGERRDVARGVHSSLSWRGDRLAALRGGARTPTQVVVYDTSRWSPTVVAVGPIRGWDDVELVEPEVVRTRADDGAELHARLYRARPATDRLLCWIHGGPTAQWGVDFSPRLAYWIGQGWNVLVPDHRGSTGHGRVYQQALHGRWGELDVSDTAALAAHAQRLGVGRPASTVVVGGSAGGMTVLGMVTADAPAGLLAGGVATYPVTDLVELADRSHRYEAHYTDSLIAPRAQEDVLRARSLSARAGLVRRPLLLTHGTQDPVVPFEGTVAFADAARSAGADVELMLFDGEGHGYTDPANQQREYELMAAFLARVVGAGGPNPGR